MIIFGYPSRTDERQVFDRAFLTKPGRASNVIQAEHLLKAREVVKDIYVDDRIKDYIVEVVFATREPAQKIRDLVGLIEYGASPRASIALALAARAHAFLRHRGYVPPAYLEGVGAAVRRLPRR